MAKLVVAVVLVLGLGLVGGRQMAITASAASEYGPPSGVVLIGGGGLPPVACNPIVSPFCGGQFRP